MAGIDESSYSVLILVVSDTVSKGSKEDQSGFNMESLLTTGKILPISSIYLETVPDEFDDIVRILKHWCDDKSVDLILTIGGTGFSQRDVTPEATKAILNREAPHLAAHMVLSCCQKSKFSVLSRSVCGTRKETLILNLPGSVKGSQECFEAIAQVVPHAIDQLKGRVKKVAAEHSKMAQLI